jgi:hypothetical protein
MLPLANAGPAAKVTAAAATAPTTTVRPARAVVLLFLVGSFLSGGYRKGYLSRQPRRLYRPRGRQKLPPF